MKPIVCVSLLVCASASPAHAESFALSSILQSSWQLEDDDAAASRIAAAVHFEKLTAGRVALKQHAAQLVIDAQADSCYLVALSPSTGGPVLQENVRWDGPSVLDFSLRGYTRGKDPFVDPASEAEKKTGDVAIGWNLPGFCTLKPGKVKLAISHQVPGTKTAIRYAVLRVTRAAFPKRVVPWLRVAVGDWCDSERREALFLQPIPGTLIYADGAPRVVLDRNDVSFFDALDITASDGITRTSYKQMHAEPTGGLKVPKVPQWVGCPNDNMRGPARSATSKAILACEARVAKKHGKTIAKANSRANALSNAGATRIGMDYGPAYSRDLATQCDPLEKAAGAAFAKTTDRIVDAMSNRPEADPLVKAWLDALVTKP